MKSHPLWVQFVTPDDKTAREDPNWAWLNDPDWEEQWKALTPEGMSLQEALKVIP